MKMKMITSGKPWEIKGLYSPAIMTYKKNLIFISGQVAYDNEGNIVGKGDIEAQARQIFTNIGDLLSAAGTDFNSVIKTNYYITDVNLWPKVSSLRTRYFKPPYPASTMVEIKSLVHPDLLLEIEVVAEVEC